MIETIHMNARTVMQNWVAQVPRKAGPVGPAMLPTEASMLPIQSLKSCEKAPRTQSYQ